MIIHLPKDISHAHAREYADSIGALCLEKPEHFVLVTNHSVKQIPTSLQDVAQASWTFDTDMQLS